MIATPLDPNNTILVLKHKDKVVGQILATSPRVTDLINELTHFYGHIEVEYKEDKDLAMISRMLGK